MTCPKCKSNDMQFSNDTFTPQKEISFFSIITIISAFILFLVGIMMIAVEESPILHTTIITEIETILSAHFKRQVALMLITVGINLFFIGFIIQILKPYKIKTRYVAICKNCASIWAIKED